MKIKKYTAPPLEENTYLIYDENIKEGYIIDPGSKPEDIIETIKDKNIKIKAILHTHGHFDHTAFTQLLVNELNVPVFLDEKDLIYTRRIKDFAYLYNREIPILENYDIYKDPIEIGKSKITVIDTPGHTPGGKCFYIPDISIIFTGDTLFKRAFGRYDLPMGNFDELKASIKKLFELPGNTIVYSGHGEETTIKEEKNNNYILKFL